MSHENFKTKNDLKVKKKLILTVVRKSDKVCRRKKHLEPTFSSGNFIVFEAMFKYVRFEIKSRNIVLLEYLFTERFSLII